MLAYGLPEPASRSELCAFDLREPRGELMR